MWSLVSKIYGVIKDHFDYKLPPFLWLSIGAITIGNSWFLPLGIIEPFVFSRAFDPWVLAVIPLLFRASGIFQGFFKKFSLYTNNVLLVALDGIYLLDVIYFALGGNIHVYVWIGVLIGFISNCICEQWGNQFKDIIPKAFPKENKDYLDCKSLYASLIMVSLSLVNIYVATFVTKEEYGVVLWYTAGLGTLAMVYQVYYCFKLKKFLEGLSL